MTYSSDPQPDELAIIADDPAPNDRVDRFLATQFIARGEPLSRSRIKALIIEQRLTENGRTLTDPSAPVKPGAHYQLLVPPPIDATPKGENIPLEILFEDQHLIVLNKPAGLRVGFSPTILPLSKRPQTAVLCFQFCSREQLRTVSFLLRTCCFQKSKFLTCLVTVS
jgi:hypothetical protein